MMKNTETILVKPVDFKFNEYFSNGLNLYKENFGKVFLAVLFTFILGIIPFCSLLAIGNFYKFCRRLRQGVQVDAAEVFSFKDFSAYFVMQLILFAVIFVSFIPMIF